MSSSLLTKKLPTGGSKDILTTSFDIAMHCTTIKFVLGGRFKESELFSEYKERIGV